MAYRYIIFFDISKYVTHTHTREISIPFLICERGMEEAAYLDVEKWTFPGYTRPCNILALPVVP